MERFSSFIDSCKTLEGSSIFSGRLILLFSAALTIATAALMLLDSRAPVSTAPDNSIIKQPAKVQPDQLRRFIETQKGSILTRATPQTHLESKCA